MKFSKLSQLILVSSVGLLVATLLSACQIVTIDFVYVASSAGLTASSNDGQIDAYAVDSESGALRPGATAVSSGGAGPVSMAVTADYKNLYVANQTDNTIVHFTIGINGALTQKDAVTLGSQGVTPVYLTANSVGTYLYLVSQSQPNCHSTCSGTLAVFNLGSGGVIGSAVANGSLNYWPLTLPGFTGDSIIPTGVTVLANHNAVFVTAFDQSAYNPGGNTTSSANPGWVFGYTVGSGGALTPSTGSPWKAGIKPSAIAADPTNRFVYVTDFASSQLIGYTIQDGDVLDFLINGPFRAGGEPSAITVDPRGKYIYVSNSLDSTVTAYVIDLSTGTPSTAVNVTGNQNNQTDTQPVAILVDPALGRFVYTANRLGNSLSGFRLDPTTGALQPAQATPFPTASEPTALVCAPHGNHSLQSVTP